MEHKSGVRGAQPLDTGRPDMRPGNGSAAREAGATDGDRRSQGADLQPRDAVSRELVGDFDSTREAQALAEYENRLRADQELLNDLQWTGFQGLAWERFAAVLFAYGFQVLFAWLMTGEVFAKCRSQGLRGVPEAGQPMRRNDAEELAYDAIGFAIPAFREKVLKVGRWNRKGGASLKTFFIGQVLIQFVGIYRIWFRDRNRERALEDRQLHRLVESRSMDAPEEGTVERLHLLALMETLDETSRRLLELKAMGYTGAEIAEILGLPSEKAVELRLYRLRGRLRGTA